MNPLIADTKKYVQSLRDFSRGRVQKYKMELIDLKSRTNISHSGITKEMNKISKAKPSHRKYEMLKSYIYFYQKKLSLDRPNKFSDELIEYRTFNMLYDGDKEQ